MGAFLRLRPGEPRTHSVRAASTSQGQPYAEIVRVAEEEKIDMIVLGTHGKGMLDKAIFGSTTERGVRRGRARSSPPDRPSTTSATRSRGGAITSGTGSYRHRFELRALQSFRSRGCRTATSSPL